jgi:hypothetical protein
VHWTCLSPKATQPILPENREIPAKHRLKTVESPALSGFLAVSKSASAFLLGFDDTRSYP